MFFRTKKWKPSSAKSIMVEFFLYLFAVIGVLNALAIILVLSFGAKRWWNQRIVPSGTVLEINFSRNIIEYFPDGQITKLALSNSIQISDIVFGLQRAAKDKRIVGLVANISASPSSFGQIQEIRDAVLKFRSSGKPAIVYSQSFGEGVSGNSSYYLATAFDEIYLQPSGELGLTGFISETRFIKTLLDNAGIKPQIIAREEYKNFRNIFTEAKYTKSHAEANNAIIQSFQRQFVEDISIGRNIEKTGVINLIERGPLNAQEGFENGLVDGLAYRDEVYEKLKKRFHKNSFIPLSRYLKKSFKNPGGQKIALIYGVGSISRGKSRFNPFTGTFVMGTETIVSALQYELIQKQIDRIYGDFINKVSSGRNIPVEQVLKIAKGRIWSGAEAKELGLVDALGGIQLAINEAAKLAGIEDPHRIQIKKFPKDKSVWDKIFFRSDQVIKNDAELFADFYASVMPVVKTIKKAGLFCENDCLSMGNVEENLW